MALIGSMFSSIGPLGATVIVGGGMASMLLGKIAWEWLKGRQDLPPIEVDCPHNGTMHKETMEALGKVNESLLQSNMHLKTIADGTAEHFRESREMTKEIKKDVWDAARRKSDG